MRFILPEANHNSSLKRGDLAIGAHAHTSMHTHVLKCTCPHTCAQQSFKSLHQVFVSKSFPQIVSMSPLSQFISSQSS